MRGPMMAAHADRIVGEPIEMYRARNKICPFNLPYVLNSMCFNGTHAEVSNLTPTRVQGYISEPGAAIRFFDVKHDGKKFRVTSVFGKLFFYFKNWDAKNP